MYKRKLLLLAGVVLPLLMVMSCKKSYTPPSDPEKAILGKWELIEYGGSSVKPTGYKEFLSSGIVRDYDYETKQFSEHQYEFSINEEILLIGTIRYFFIYYDNKMQLKHKDLIAITDDTAIYQRIK